MRPNIAATKTALRRIFSRRLLHLITDLDVFCLKIALVELTVERKVRVQGEKFGFNRTVTRVHTREWRDMEVGSSILPSGFHCYFHCADIMSAPKKRTRDAYVIWSNTSDRLCSLEAVAKLAI